MNPAWPVNLDPAIHTFLVDIVTWAEMQPDLLAAALVGSHARGTATADSDIDLVLLFKDPLPNLTDRSWLASFGIPMRCQREEYGKVTSLRAWYANGLEVEFGLTDSTWAADANATQDEGEGLIIREGIIILYEQEHHLSKKVASFDMRS